MMAKLYKKRFNIDIDKYVLHANHTSAGVDFSRQIQTSDSDDWSRSTLCKSKHIYNGRRPIT